MHGLKDLLKNAFRPIGRMFGSPYDKDYKDFMATDYSRFRRPDGQFAPPRFPQQTPLAGIRPPLPAITPPTVTPSVNPNRIPTVGANPSGGTNPPTVRPTNTFGPMGDSFGNLFPGSDGRGVLSIQRVTEPSTNVYANFSDMLEGYGGGKLRDYQKRYGVL